MEVKFEVLGTPVGKGRPKFSTRGGYARAITPEKTVNYENLVKLSYSFTCGQTVLQGAIKAQIKAFFPIPKSTSKKMTVKMESGEVFHTHRPDADNIVKAILDALNGVAYHDDSQVVHVDIVKLYSANPRAEIILTELSEVQV